MSEKDELKLAVQKEGLSTSRVEEIMSNFSTVFSEARKIVAEVKDITVTSPDQLEEIGKAKEARLKLKKLRIDAEKTRIMLKEASVREGKAIDGAANIIKALIVPIEEHLEKQEKFLELQQQRLKEEKLALRKEQLGKYIEDLSIYNLEIMNEDAFANLLESAKKVHEEKIALDKKLEADRIAAEARQKVLNERQIKLAPYTQFLKDFVLTEQTTAEEFVKQLNLGMSAKKDYDKAQEKIRLENEKLKADAKKRQYEQIKKDAAEKARIDAENKKKEAELEKERLEKEKYRKELLDKQEAEKQALKEKEMKEAADKAAAEEAERQAKLAPDKDKMRALYKELSDFTNKLATTDFHTVEGKTVATETHAELQDVLSGIVSKMKQL